MAAPFTETGCHVGTRLKAGRRGGVGAASAFETTWSIDATAGAGPRSSESAGRCFPLVRPATSKCAAADGGGCVRHRVSIAVVRWHVLRRPRSGPLGPAATRQERDERQLSAAVSGWGGRPERGRSATSAVITGAAEAGRGRREPRQLEERFPQKMLSCWK